MSGNGHRRPQPRMLTPEGASTTELGYAADTARAAAAVAVMLAHVPADHPEQMLLAPIDALPAEIRTTVVELQKATSALGTLARKKAPDDTPWNVIAQILIKLSIDAEARKRR